MKYRYYIVFILFLSATLTEILFSVEKTNEWVNYTLGTNVRAMVSDGKYLWVGGDGLARIDIKTNEVTRYNKANSGLPENKIWSLAIDKNGVLWIGSGNYLSKFDGIVWTVFDTLPKKILIGDIANHKTVFKDNKWTIIDTIPNYLILKDISAFAVDKNNHLWAASDNFIGEFDGKVWKIHKINELNRYFRLFVTTIAIDSNNNVWIGMKSYGNFLNGDGDFQDKVAIYKYDRKTWIKYDKSNSKLPEYSMNNIAIDKNNKVWFCSGKGIFYFDNSTEKLTNTNGNLFLDNHDVLSMSFDKSKDSFYLICLNRSDIYKVSINNPDNIEIINTGKPIPIGNLEDVLCDNNGNFWICSYQFRNKYLGLAKFSSNEWRIIGISNSELRNDHIDHLLFDKDNNLWILTYSAGIYMFDGKNWNNYSEGDFKELKYKANGIVVDEDFNLWILLDNGIARINSEDEWSFVNCNKNPMKLFLMFGKMILSNGNEIFIAGDKLTHFSPDDWSGNESINLKMINNNIQELDENNGIFSIAEDNNGKIILGTKHGLFYYNSKNDTIEVFDTSFKYNEIHTICFDLKNRIWISNNNYYKSKEGTHYSSDELIGGIAMFDGQWHHYDSTNSGLTDNLIYVIKCDSENNMWFGTRKGLVKYDGESWTVFNEENSGLPNNYVKTLAFDKHGNLWIGTRDGLAVYRKGGVILE